MKWVKGILLGLFVLLLILTWSVVGLARETTACRGGDIESCVNAAPQVISKLETLSRVVPLKQVREPVAIFKKIEPLLEDSEYWLGKNEETVYTVLLLNDRELRTFGGFMGSYAVVIVNNGGYEVRFEDIYVPDGQIEGYIAPPEPLQRAFKTGSHRLPNADWSPDFPKSATAIRWFFDKGKEVVPDVLITLNISTMEKIMGVIGEIEIAEYGETLNQDNFYKWLEDNTEVNFFPGSTQKRDALTATGKKLMQKLENLSFMDKFKVAKIIFEDLENKNIVVNSTDESAQNTIHELGWSGEYAPLVVSDEKYQAINVGVIEMNLGVNKANCCVSRVMKQRLVAANGRLVHLIEVEISNHAPQEFAVKPKFYGGNYLSYLRFYIPEKAENIQVSALPTITGDLGLWPQPYSGNSEELDIQQVYGFSEVGLFNTTRAGTTSWIRVVYELEDEGKDIKLGILKQPGIREVETTLELLGKTKTINLVDDYVVEIRR